MSRKKLTRLSKVLLGTSADLRRAGLVTPATHERIVQRISGKPLSPESAAALDTPRPNRATRHAMGELEEGKGNTAASVAGLFKDLGI
ncbi:hypothetical protein [Novosphingobium sp. FKTRR1]|uniref:hypothetical protein n=1 Tax=Novosphingobium sp. FKTRR1 TaxID=2879118 RepID=UPI001CEFB97D|nr:hypothetical protein [Novosphingobium sp. FKTRR1]